MNEECQQAIQLLKNKKSVKRCSGAKKLRKLECPDAGPELLEALKKEIQDERTWETQYHMIMALGQTGWQKGLQFLRDLVKCRFEHTMVYMAIGDALVRLSPTQNSFSDIVNDLLNTENPMIIEGGLRGLAMTKSILPQEISIRLFEYVNLLPRDERGMWCRVWVAAAAAGWDYPEIKKLLGLWIESDFIQLQRAANASLKGKYLKWSPL